MVNLIELLYENEYQDDLTKISSDIANALKSELEAMDSEPQKLKEAIDPISIVSYILASTTLLNIISKWASKIFAKYDFGKGVEAADKIYHFTHKLEEDFQAPIRRIVGLFTKDPDTTRKISGVIYSLFLLFLGAKAGSEAVNALKNTKIPEASGSLLKAALKGKDIKTVLKAI